MYVDLRVSYHGRTVNNLWHFPLETSVAPTNAYHTWATIEDEDLIAPPITEFLVTTLDGINYVIYQLTWIYSDNLPSSIGVFFTLEIPGEPDFMFHMPPWNIRSAFVTD